MKKFFLDSKIVEIVALEQSTLTTLPNSTYTAFNTKEGSGLTYQKMDQLISTLVPEFATRSTKKRMSTIEKFKVIELNSNTLFERQGEQAKFLYLLLNGEVAVYRQTELLAKEDGIVCSSKIPLWSNPNDSGN
jgi:CRP-like cAMP-binding protein